MKRASGLWAMGVVLGVFAVASADQLPKGARTTGFLVRIDSTELTIRDRNDSNSPERTITISERTDVRVDGEAATLKDLRPRMHVSIESKSRVKAGEAEFKVEATSKRLIGKVARVEGSTIVVKSLNIREDKEWMVETDKNTIIVREAGVQGFKPIKLEDIKEGEEVTVTPDEGLAKKVVVGGRSYISSKPRN